MPTMWGASSSMATPLSSSLSCTNCKNLVTELGNATFSTKKQEFFVAGTNVLLVSDANTGGGPSAAAFYAIITYLAAAQKQVLSPSR